MKNDRTKKTEASAFPKSDRRAGFLLVVIILIIFAWEITTKEGFWPSSMTKSTKELILVVPTFIITMLYLYSIENDTLEGTAKKIERFKSFFQKKEG